MALNRLKTQRITRLFIAIVGLFLVLVSFPSLLNRCYSIHHLSVPAFIAHASDGAFGTHISVSSNQESTLHPIEQHIVQAKKMFSNLVEKQSRSLAEAKSEYVKRYDRAPPPGFDHWYERARGLNATVVDNFDTIMDALTPFWGYSAGGLRKAVRLAVDADDDVFSLGVKNGSLLVSQVGPYGRYADEMARWMRPLLEQNLLSDMEFAYSALDEPRVVVPYHFLNRVKAPCSRKNTGAQSRDSDLKESVKFTDLSRQNIWPLATSSCPPDYRGLLHHSSETNLDILPFINEMQNPCDTPDAAHTHGYFTSPDRNIYTDELLPIFTKNKPSNYQDLLMPSPFYTELDRQGLYNEEEDPAWEEKSDKLYWAGRTTGGWSHGENWHELHRHRFVHDVNDPDRQITLLRQNNDSKTWEAYRDTMSTFSGMIDVKFSTLWRNTCEPSECDRVKQTLPFKDPVPESEGYKSRFVFDIDGFGFTERFYRLLGSRSTVFKMTMFQEWHEDRLVPWVHYVPVSLSMDELPEMLRFFTTEKGRELAREIAEAGREWKNRVLRSEDIELAFHRILLEWGRLVGDERDQEFHCHLV